MNKLSFLILIIYFCQINSYAQKVKNDSLAIRETVADYIEGWYSGDTARIKMSLHSDLAKRGVLASRDGKGVDLVMSSYSEMIDWTGKNPNLIKENKVLKSDLKITIIEIGVNIANVKCVSNEYIDYLQLARINNQWKILNAIWEFNYQEIMKMNK
ncbi:MAG: nuclear transport factor 2 family protein [Bacteroidetes bacterium]|nr:nuclear transport factor 2 family protein [Bacteroidota bacterium]